MSEEKEIKPTEEVKDKPVFESVEVTTQTAPAIQTPEGKIITEGQAIVMLLNEIKELKDNLI